MKGCALKMSKFKIEALSLCKISLIEAWLGIACLNYGQRIFVIAINIWGWNNEYNISHILVVTENRISFLP